MLNHLEKRNLFRMHLDCDIAYKSASSAEVNHGRCKSISGSGVSFIADQPIGQGKALEIKVVPKNAASPSMTAFIKVVRITLLPDNTYEIAASIKSIKGS